MEEINPVSHRHMLIGKNVTNYPETHFLHAKFCMNFVACDSSYKDNEIK